MYHVDQRRVQKSSEVDKVSKQVIDLHMHAGAGESRFDQEGLRATFAPNTLWWWEKEHRDACSVDMLICAELDLSSKCIKTATYLVTE